MRCILFVLAAGLGLVAIAAQAAGLRTVEVPADADGPALRVQVWSPCAMPPEETRLGPLLLPAVRGCPVLGDQLPLIVISHGHGGGYLSHHDTAEALADAGFVVAALNHPGDNFADMSRADDIATMFERPTDIRRLIDFMLGAFPDAARIDPRRIGLFGFSRGGYTGLVIAGARPDFHDARVPCPEPAPICGQIRRNEIPTGPLTRDPRVKAAVIVDPLSFFPTTDSLRAVTIPVQLWGSQFGGDGVLPDSVAALARTLPDPPEFHLVANAGHFSFLAPCPPAWAKAQPEICADPAGFDRAAFHRDFDAQILAFFRAHVV
jgi:predicted dienelactone hydrolase